DARNNRVALFDGIEEGGIRASSLYSSYNEIDEQDNERAMGGLSQVIYTRRWIVITGCWTAWFAYNYKKYLPFALLLFCSSLIKCWYLFRGMTWILQEEFFQELWTNSKWYVDCGLTHFDEVLREADGIIQSRGNLGIDLPPEKVFLFRKSALYKCNMAGKPAVLTRVVDSMTDNLRPTRAEATDVANAVLDGSDAILLGVETLRGLYPIETISTFGRICSEKPLILALSNPTSQSGCTAEEAYTWSKGQAIFASGSPFDPVEYEGKVFVPGQTNNAYIFPGFVLGLLISGAIRVRDEMLLAACEFIQAKRRLNILKSIQSKFQEGRTKNSLTVSSYATAEALAAQVSQENYDKGLIYPPFSNIRKISAHIAANVVARHMNL
ncbi:hypothetical protein S83_047172, partial [Arachis hypogaea]